MKQSVHDVVTGELSLEYFAKRFSEGWRLASIEWVRDSGEMDVPIETRSLLMEEATVPYGFVVTESGLRENPLEATVLLLILDQIIKERGISEIARELNMQGYSTREGTTWAATDVFNLMPRLIEAGPSLLKSAAWQERRRTVEKEPHHTN